MNSPHRRVAVLGVGKIAQLKYLPYVADNSSLELVAICDADRDFAASVGSEFGCSHVYDDPRSMAAAKPDVTFILNHNHPEAIELSAAKGAKILVEKPLAWSAGQAMATIRKARSAGAHLFPAFMRRYDPVTNRIRQEIEARGQPLAWVVRQYAGRGNTLRQDLKPGDTGRKRIKSQLASDWEYRLSGMTPQVAKAVRLMLELAIHDIDIAIYIYKGPLAPRSVTLGNSEASPALYVTFQPRTGPVCSLHCVPVFGAGWPWHHAIEAVWKDVRVEAFFSNPFDDINRGRVLVYRGDSYDPDETFVPEPQDPFSIMLDRFFRADDPPDGWFDLCRDAELGLAFVDACETELKRSYGG